MTLFDLFRYIVVFALMFGSATLAVGGMFCGFRLDVERGFKYNVLYGACGVSMLIGAVACGLAMEVLL